MAWEGIEKPITATSVRFAPGQHARYIPNHRSFGAFMKSDQMRDVTEDVAQDIATSAANSIEPSDTADGLRSRVKAGFKVKRNAGLLKVAGNLRVKVEIVNNADGAPVLEFGGRGLKKRRMLGRAGARFGDFKPEGGPE